MFCIQYWLDRMIDQVLDTKMKKIHKNFWSLFQLRIKVCSGMGHTVPTYHCDIIRVGIVFMHFIFGWHLHVINGFKENY